MPGNEYYVVGCRGFDGAARIYHVAAVSSIEDIQAAVAAEPNVRARPVLILVRPQHDADRS